MKSVQLGRIAGVPVNADQTLIIALPLLAYLIGTTEDHWIPLLDRQFAVPISPSVVQGPVATYGIGILAAIGLFATVLAHELGHTIVARRRNYPITAITLWLFGGLTNLQEIPRDWRDELAIAAGGPLVSVGLGIGLFGAFRALPVVVDPEGSLPVVALVFLLGFLSVANLALVGFNLVPGFPMDGGRIARAILSITLPYDRATHTVVELGKGFALLLGAIGVLTGLNFGLIVIAFLIYLGATAENAQTTIAPAFDGLCVRDVMTSATDVVTVGPSRSITELFDRLYTNRHTSFPVVDDDQLVGLVSLAETPATDEFERERLQVSDIMDRTPHAVSPQVTARHALTTMQLAGLEQLLVIEQGAFVGLLTRTDLLDTIEIVGDTAAVGRPMQAIDRW